MPAYCVGQIRVKDPAAWEDYRSRVGATIAQYGGQVLFRGRQTRVLSGGEAPELVVSLRFETVADAGRWHDSPEYQALVPLRERAAEVKLVLYED